MMSPTECDQLLGATPGAILTYEESDAAAPRLASLSMDDLQQAWRCCQTTPYREITPAVAVFQDYFGGLGQNDPQRAMEFITTMISEEPDDELVALMATGTPLSQLIYFNGPEEIESLEALAVAAPRFRWLMGAVYWDHGGFDPKGWQHRLLPLCDREAFEAWRVAHWKDGQSSSAVSSPADFARLWVEYHGASPREQWRMGFLDDSELRDQFDRCLSVIIAIRRIEDNPHLLGFLSAGLLEDLIPFHDGPQVDAIVAEAERNPPFADLLLGVWYYDVDTAVLGKLRRVAPISLDWNRVSK